MKKLTQWVIGLNTLCIIWLSILFQQYDSNIPKEYYFIIQFLPVISIIVFGVVSLVIVLYRVATFNDCQLAATELRAEIDEAKKALQEKGFKFD